MIIAQMSDPHLRPPGVLYQGLVDSNAMLEGAVAAVNAMVPKADIVLLSGDVVDEGSAVEYAHARDLLARLEAPLAALPGNHDEREAFRRAFADQPWIARDGPMHLVIEEAGPVRIVGLDVTVPGAHHGLFDAAAAAWLDATLSRAPGRPTIVMMHQPPIACGVGYLDDYRCFGAALLAAVIGRHPQVEWIVCGHVHRMMQQRFAGTLLLTAPSTTTAISLRLGTDAEPASFVDPPAFLLHHWRDGGLITHVMPIGTYRGPLPFA